jgi:hypothetical protein
MIVWTQTLNGRVFNLLEPTPEMIDFREIADTLANLNRYAGAAWKPVSVAAHTLVAMDAAAPEDKGAVLLHDAHEAFIGDIITPTAAALADIIETRGGPDSVRCFTYAVASLKRRLDAAIHEAAGLPLPDAAQAARIRSADIVALRTERRDFLAAPQRAWGREVEAAKPLPKKYRFRAAPDVAAALFMQFQVHLPALRVGRAA